MSDSIQRGPDNELGRMVLSGSAWLIGARIARTMLTLCGMIVLARLLSPVDFGVLAFATSATVLSLTVVEGLIDYPAVRDDGLSTQVVRSLVWGSMAITALLALALWFGAPWLERAMHFPRLALGLRAMIPICFAQVFIVAGTALLRRQHRFATIAQISVASVAIYVLLAIALSLAGYGLLSVLISFNTAQLATAIMLIVTARLPLLPPRRFDVGDNWHVGGWGALSRLVSWGWGNIDTFAISAALGPAATGLYSRAYNINVQAKEPFAAIDQTIRQAFAALKHREEGFAAQTVMALRLITVLSGFTAAAMIVLRDFIILVLLGSQWGGAAPALALLAAGLPARIARLYFDSLTISTGNMQTLVARHVAILLIIAIGLFVVADRGIGWVAAVVSGALYLSLFFANGAGERRAGAGLLAVIRAMAPGVLLGAMLVGVAEIISYSLPPLGLAGDTAARAAVMAAGGIGLLLLTPTSWLGEKIAANRHKVLARMRR